MFVLRLACAAASGAAVYLSYEPHGYWFAAIGGIAILWLVFQPYRGKEVSLKAGALLGFAHGIVQYLLMLPWIGELVGTMPYVALAISLSLYSLLLGVGASILARVSWGFAGFPFFYLAIELLRSSVPFGGFGWVRLAWGQIDGPLRGLAQWGGTALVSLLAVVVAVGLAQLLTRARLAGALMAAIPLLVGAGATYAIDHRGEDANAGTVKVAAIQGNVPRLGLDFLGQRRAVLNNHLKVTEEVARSGFDPDIVVWPENSSDINPFDNPDAYAAISAAAREVGAPVLVGTRTEDAVGERNTMQVFSADGTPGEFHHKKYLQPFGETMPMRSFFRKITDLVDLAGDFKPGNGDGVVHMNGVALGVATCYEVSFDAAFRTSINHGAEILSTPTNNATFGFSDMTYQQLAMSRLRAIETDRAVVVAATSGVSAIVDPAGTVWDSTKIFTPDYLTATLPLRKSITPAVKYGFAAQAIAVALGLIAVMVAALRTVFSRAGRTKDKKRH